MDESLGFDAYNDGHGLRVLVVPSVVLVTLTRNCTVKDTPSTNDILCLKLLF